MKIKITADTVADLSKELYEKYDVSTVPLITVLGSEEHFDGVDITPQQLIDYCNKNKVLPKTASRSVETYAEFFQKYLDEGFDAVIHFNISADMSASFEAANEASKRFENVYAVDSRNLSSGVGLLVLAAKDLAEEGKDAKTIYDTVMARRDATQASFVVDKLELLHRGGRCSSIAYLGANLLGIKPCIEVAHGKMTVARKYFGRFEKVLFKYIDETLKKFHNPDKTRCFITHTVCTYVGLVDQVVEFVKAKNIFKEVLDTTAGCTVTTHCGANTLGILYINDSTESI